jgi:hypothetical protein
MQNGTTERTYALKKVTDTKMITSIRRLMLMTTMEIQEFFWKKKMITIFDTFATQQQILNSRYHSLYPSL